MTETYTVRFYETERYDIELDRNAIQFIATTPTGSYCAEVEMVPGAKTRERREAFKEYVLQCISLKVNPHEFDLG